jgi:hypothetical protein
MVEMEDKFNYVYSSDLDARVQIKMYVNTLLCFKPSAYLWFMKLKYYIYIVQLRLDSLILDLKK